MLLYLATLLKIVFVTHVNYLKPVMVDRQLHLISTCGLLYLFYISLINTLTSGFQSQSTSLLHI